MRINVYSQEMLTEGPQKTVELVVQQSDNGITYSAVRIFLKSPDELHHTDEDDDRSAITFWLPKSYNRRLYIAQCFKRMAAIIENQAPQEMGLD